VRRTLKAETGSIIWLTILQSTHIIHLMESCESYKYGLGRGSLGYEDQSHKSTQTEVD